MSKNFQSLHTFFAKPIVLLIAFFFFSLALRSIFLTTTPAFITHDEMYYAVEAQSLAVSGKDVSGTWNPFLLQPAHVLYAELPGTIMTPAALLFSHPLVKARATHVFLGTLFPFILAAIIWSITKSRALSITTLVFASFNPWVFQFSRMNFDSLLSLFFYGIGVLILLNTQGWKRLWAVLPFVLGFYQYQGLKLVFLPLLAVVLMYITWQEYTPPLRKNLTRFRPAAVIFGVALLVFAIYVIRLRTQSASTRLNDIIFFNNEYVSHLVNTQRRLALDNPFSAVFTNKVTIIIVEMLSKYAKAFDPGFLFMYGEPVRNPFSVWSMGIFHMIDLLFILVGSVTLWLKKKWLKPAVLLLAVIVISPLPVIINTIDTWIMFRSALLYPCLIILSAIGFYSLWQYPSKLSRGLLLGVYSLSLIWFGYQYYFRYPIYSTTGQYFAERVMSNYIKRLGEKNVTVLASESRFVFESYLYYNNLITRQNVPEINQAIQTRVHKLGNVRFDTNCFDLRDMTPDSVIISEAINVECPESERVTDKPAIKRINIPSLIDSGAIFRVYNDSLCSQYNLQNYSRVQSRKILDVENLSDQEFCLSLFSYD